MESTGTTVEVFAELVCPFTHVGLRRFVEEREARGRSDVKLWVRAWPLEVVNDASHDAAFMGAEVRSIRDQTAPDHFTGFDESAFPSTTLPGLALAHAAYRSSPEVGEEVSLALRDMVFEQGVDISDADVLGQIAARHGLEVTDADREAVVSDHAEGLSRGVVGSPYFFTPNGNFFCPALDIGHDDRGEMKVSVDQEGLARFLAAVFGTDP